MELRDRVAIVTGAAGGIGSAICRALAAEGCRVVLTGRRAEPLEALAAEMRRTGADTLVVTGDASQAGDVEKVVAAALDRFEHLDILVNNAGITRDGLLVRLKDEDWDQVLAVNLRGAFLYIRAVARHMLRQKWGRIINLSSIIGLVGNAGQANYAAAKAGLIGLTKAAARELASRNITVNAVAPGLIDTTMSEARREKTRPWLERLPVGRLGTPEEVAHLVCYLASSKAGYITGQVISMDGGLALL